MSELSRRVLHARQHVDVRLDEQTIAEGVARLERRILVRRRRLRAASALAVAAGALALAWFGWSRQTGGDVLATRDGSTALSLVAETALSLERESESEVVVALARGAGHFEVARNPARRYRVRAGRVLVQVLGTAFDVRRGEGRVFVRVQRGAVEVTWPEGKTILRAGAERWFSEEVEPSASGRTALEPQALKIEQATEPVDDMAVDSPASSDADVAARAGGVSASDDTRAAPLAKARPSRRARLAPRAPAVEHGRWRELARAGRHREAFQSLGALPIEDCDGLLLAADAARLSGHPREAALHLTSLIERYPNDVRARLAAFTLGRLALHELDQPLLAARSFARAYALDPDGELAADALAREAEAYHRAGDGEGARAAAKRYLSRYPDGARRKELSSYLEAR